MTPKPADVDALDATAVDVLDSYRIVPESQIFAIGLFDSAVTVLSQQVRALNLAWSMMESRLVTLDRRPKIAVVGAGFAGLSFVAGLVGRQVPADITIFEKRDSVLPLQQGTDSRWLHPHIYDWPTAGSEASSAGLPVLNWTAARASDVVVQTLASWRTLLSQKGSRTDITLFCNATHLQVDEDEEGLSVEWIGQKRNPREPSVLAGDISQMGRRDRFDAVVLAIGFGIETDDTVSYWRNETLAQPALNRSRTTYIVSGAGDGGWIDLFRLRIANFRQDRILGELFEGESGLLDALRGVQRDAALNQSAVPKLRQLWKDEPQASARVAERLRTRLRHDTSAVLQLRRRTSFSDIFAGRRVSFQNQLLAWILYDAGGFGIWTGTESELARNEDVSEEQIIRRHGPQAIEGLKRVLGPRLHNLLIGEDGKARENEDGDDVTQLCRQDDSIRWHGGYFDKPLHLLDDEEKGHWRREYLPSPTRLLASVLAGAVAKFLAPLHPDGQRLRVTLHRVLEAGSDVVLQQCCDYTGVAITGSSSTAGRTFPAHNGTIGLAYSTGRVVRSVAESTNDEIQADMAVLDLDEASRRMSPDVRSLLAVPMLAGADGDTSDGSVVGVLYVDSESEGFFADEDLVKVVVSLCEGFLSALDSELEDVAGQLSNASYWSSRNEAKPAEESGGRAADALELLDIDPPRGSVMRLNVDVASFFGTGVR